MKYSYTPAPVVSLVMNFQDTIKETPEQIKIRLKDKQILSLLTDVIGASFAANVIQLASPESGDGSEVNSYWSCTRPFFPQPIYGKKRCGHARLTIGSDVHYI